MNSNSECDVIYDMTQFEYFVKAFMANYVYHKENNRNSSWNEIRNKYQQNLIENEMIFKLELREINAKVCLGIYNKVYII